MCLRTDGRMESRKIPIQNDSLPGSVRLPRRYEVCVTKETQNETGQTPTGPTSRDGDNERLRDLSQAINWVKQELVQLRQHDILLKRQFTDIQDTIHGLSRSRRHMAGVTSLSKDSLQSTSSLDLGLDNYSVRSASSVTALHDTDTDTDDEAYRPRTCSMRTTRDLAAKARRRGSKELI